MVMATFGKLLNLALILPLPSTSSVYLEEEHVSHIISTAAPQVLPHGYSH